MSSQSGNYQGKYFKIKIMSKEEKKIPIYLRGLPVEVHNQLVIIPKEYNEVFGSTPAKDTIITMLLQDYTNFEGYRAALKQIKNSKF